MAINRTVLIQGPARVTYNSEVFFSKGAITIELETETSPTNTEKFGKVDEVILEAVHRVRFTPVGEWEALSTLFPHKSLAIGASIFGATDKALRILGANGDQFYWPNAAVLDEPNCAFRVEETILGEVTFLALRGNATAWATDESLLEVSEGEVVPSDTEFTLPTRQAYSGTWGASSPWVGFDTLDGFAVETTSTVKAFGSDACGIVDYRLTAYEAKVRFTPVESAMSDVLAALKHQGSGAARGSGINSLGNLEIAGTGVLFRLVNAGIMSAKGSFSSTVNRVGEIELKSTRAQFSGPQFFVSDMGALTDISGLIHDFNADLGVTESSLAVSSWQSQAGAGLTAVQATAGAKPTLAAAALNGRAGLTFDGSNDTLVTPSSTVYSQPLTWFLVVMPSNVAAAAYQTIVTGAGAQRNLIRKKNTTSGIVSMYAGGTLADSSAALLNGTPYVIAAQFNGASSVLRFNGAQVVAANVGAEAINVIHIGADAGASAFPGKIFRIAVYNAALTASQMSRVESYLRAYYGF